MYILYGIKNCDKVRAAKKWLDAENIQYQFEDIRDNPVPLSNWKNWLEIFGVDKLINRRSTTWKKLSEEDRQNLSVKRAINLLAEHPTLMKRPLLSNHGTGLMIGFSGNQYSDYFNQ